MATYVFFEGFEVRKSFSRSSFCEIVQDEWMAPSKAEDRKRLKAILDKVVEKMAAKNPSVAHLKNSVLDPWKDSKLRGILAGKFDANATGRKCWKSLG